MPWPHELLSGAEFPERGTVRGETSLHRTLTMGRIILALHT